MDLNTIKVHIWQKAVLQNKFTKLINTLSMFVFSIFEDLSRLFSNFLWLSRLFDNETAWTKKNHSNMFDVTMGSFDGAEVCELIGLFLLDNFSEKYGKNNVGLYRDDGLVLLKNASGPQSERTRKDITREFKRQGLIISISANLKICNFLDVTLILTDGSYYPYRKPNNRTLYIDTNSNHPPTIIKHLPAAIGRRISDISSNKELFNKAKPHYESVLKRSGHDEKLTYTERKKAAAHTAQNSRKNRQRNVIWLNPPYSMNVQKTSAQSFWTSSANTFRKTTGTARFPAKTT